MIDNPDSTQRLIGCIRGGNSQGFFELAASYPEAIHRASASGVYPLNVAIDFQRDEIVEFLLEKNVELNDASTILGKFTPLMMAIGKKRFEYARRLLERGARPDLKDYRGRTAWDNCLSEGNREGISFLLNHCKDSLDAFSFVLAGR